MATITLTIDGISVTAPADSSILEAATLAGIRIPTLCYLKDVNVKANCRICLVEVAGGKALQPACATKIAQGMEIHTNTPAVHDARKTNLELILSSHSWGCHHCLRIGNYTTRELKDELCGFCFFCDCVKDGDCTLQDLAKEYDVNVLPFAWSGDPYPPDESTGAVARNPNKCIKCRRCIEVCSSVQTVGALGVAGRGAGIQIAPLMGKSLADSPCVRCGRCIDACPTGAIYAVEQFEPMLYTVRLERDQKTIAQVSRDIKPELARLLHLDSAALDLGQLAAGLHKIGIHYIVSDDYARGRALVEAETAICEKRAGASAPVLATDSSAALAFLQNEFADLSASLVACRSAEQEFGRLAKGEWAHRLNDVSGNLCAITLSRDASYKAEALGSDAALDFVPYVDYVLTPREIARLLNKTAVDLTRLEPRAFDSPATGGAPKSALYALLDCPARDRGVTELTLTLGRKECKAAVAHSLGDARRLLEQMRAGLCPYDLIWICA